MANFSVILAGGSGTRLWPLSRKNFPKQFLTLYGERSLLQHTYLRMAQLSPAENIFVVTGQEHFYNVLNQLREVAPEFSERQIIVEPEGRNTFPAILLALRYLEEEFRAQGNDAVIFTPADAYVGDTKAYTEALKFAQLHAGRGLVLVGITPTSPEVGYGYIKVGKEAGAIRKIHSFHEKPDQARAKRFVASGNYLWNAGIYAGTIESFVLDIKEIVPEAYALYTQGLEKLRSDFSSLPALSIDYALTEHSTNVFVVPATFDWSDVGSFDALSSMLERRGMKYAKHVALDSTGVFIHSESGRLVATIGVDDLVVIDHHDSILIHKKGRGKDVGQALKLLKEQGAKEVEHNLLVHRPWGQYEVLIDTPNYKVKKITVYPGAKLSLQSHKHRAEHWVVVEGEARVEIGKVVSWLKKNQSTFIPALERHRLENPGNVDLEIVEVQTGQYLGEDDITRHEDAFRRS